MWWEEAVVATVSSIGLFIIFSTQAAMRLGRIDGFPVILWRVYGPEYEVGPLRRWIAIIGAGMFAAIGQLPVLVVAEYRWDELGLAPRLLLVGEVVAAFVWSLLLWKWVRASSRA